MCGIIGIFGKENVIQLVSDALKTISNRGKDNYSICYGINKLDKIIYSDKPVFENLKGNLAIGHCLHAIVNKIKQPFSGKGKFIVNCEIYNWIELVNKYGIEAKNDAELFFLLLEKLGVEKTLDLIDGDYAGSYILDNKVYLFRDRIGVKPLWYSNDSCFAFASEKKALKKIGFNNIVELNPRELLIYDFENKTLEINNLEFYKIEKLKVDYLNLKKKLAGYLINAISKRVPDVKFGLLFSGGVDSSFIALILKELGLDFNCYVCCVKGLGNSEDLGYAKKVSEKLNLKLKIVEVSLEELEKELPLICKLVESNNVTKIAVALPFYFACKAAKKGNIKVVLSGQGSEELFAGYERHLKSSDINKESYNGLLNIYERDLYRDDVVSMYNNVELRVPFLDSKLISFALGIDSRYKINEKGNKVILREIAFDFGLDKEFAFRKRKAAQYGSNFLKAIEKLSKKNKCKNKSEYLNQFYNEVNVKLAALFSSGKDSCYAMYVMKKQNYDIKCLITIKSRNKDSYMYHTPNVDLVKLQAEALGIPLIMQETEGEKEKELDDLEKALLKAKKEFFIEGVVVGALFSTYQRDRVQRVADKLGLKVFAPLWHKDQLLLLKELIQNKFEVIVVHVAADGLDKSFLGRKLNDSLISDLVKLHQRNKINIAFEGGEAESLVLDCPMFKKKLRILEAEKIMQSENVGTYEISKVVLVDK